MVCLSIPDKSKEEQIMLATFIAITAIVVAIAIWIISMQNKLVILDENVKSAMSQIGAQISSRFDALMAVLELMKDYAKSESELLIEAINSQRSMITAKSTPDEVIRQEEIIIEALDRIAMITKQYPELKENKTYITAMNAVLVFENMVRTSGMIYNDSVTKLNREIKMLPASMISKMLGFRQRSYLENQATNIDMQSVLHP